MDIEIPYQITYTLFAILSVTFLFFLTTFNSFVRQYTNIQEAFSNIEVQLKRKLSLIDNLVSLVREYAKHEQTTFENVAKARALISSAQSVNDALVASNMIEETLQTLYAVVENYPELKADQHYKNLMKEMTETEDAIANFRHHYNLVVGQYNKSLQTFPNLISASIFNFSPSEFYDKDNERS